MTPNQYYISQSPASVRTSLAQDMSAIFAGNMLHYGLIANDSTQAVANSAAIVALFDPTVPGPSGRFYFPNLTGTDTYYFSTTPIQVRDGVTLDLNGCTLNFSGAFNAALSTYGFFVAIRDVGIENGSIAINYNGTGGVNNGVAMRLGSRNGYPFGTYSTGIYDQDDLVAHGLPLQGNIRLSKLRISTNNPAATHIILLLGGLRAIIMEDVWLDGGSAVQGNGVYYEYGWSSANGAPGTISSWTSSHMTASFFRNIIVTNLATGGTSQGFGFNGAYDCTVEDVYVNGADQGFGFGTGEAMFYRVWALDAVSPARQLTLRNLTTLNCTLCIALGGANPVGGGYLAAVINALPTAQKFQAQTDLLSFTLDGFSIATNPLTGTCISATGAHVAIKNGSAVGGAVNFGAEAQHCTLENVSVLNSGGPNGVRFGAPGAIWSPVRPAFVTIKNNKICGSVGVAVAVGACQSASIDNNQFGYNTLYDVAAEAAQTNGVNLQATSFGVKCRGNFISTAGGAASYQSANNTLDNMNSIENERNQQTTGGGGAWDTDFQSPAAQVIATNGTIVSLSLKGVRLAPAGAVTGVRMQAGQRSGQIAFLENESAAASTITMDVAATSLVADGVGCVIAGLTTKLLIWNSSTNRWSHI